MLRRRSSTIAAEPVTASLAERLGAEGWVLPWALQDRRRGGEPSSTLVGTVESPIATTVDPAGLVVGSGWSLDWWVGGDDRWHLPSQEASVRQGLLGDAPIVETRLRVPGGDVVQRAFGIRAPRMVGDEWVVVEVENQTPVPCAIALVVRPLVADAVGAVSSIDVSPTLGGTGRDEAHLVRVDGCPALVLPRRPNAMAVGNRAMGDVVATVTGGEAGAEMVAARCDEGLATAAFVYPLPHTAVLRVLVPVGVIDDAETIAMPSAVPDAAAVASGWDVHARGPRIALPEPRAASSFERARRHVALAFDGSAIHRDGAGAPSIEAGATEVLLGALDALDRPAQVGPIVVGWADLVTDVDVDTDTTFLTSVSRHQRLHRVEGVLDWVLPDVAAAVERLDRADRRGRLSPWQRVRAGAALDAVGDLLATSGQGEGAVPVRALAERVRGGAPAPEPVLAVDRLLAAADALAAGRPGAFDQLEAVLAEASPTGSWSGPAPDAGLGGGVGSSGRRLGHDLAASAAAVLAVRALLVAERDDGLDLLPSLPPTWFGGGVELHDAPTAWGRLSYGVRWHGARPALLWEVEVHEGQEAPVLRAPALDPEMRKPGEDPGPPPVELPEGGSFS